MQNVKWESQWENQIGCNFERMFTVQFREQVIVSKLTVYCLAWASILYTSSLA